MWSYLIAAMGILSARISVGIKDSKKRSSQSSAASSYAFKRKSDHSDGMSGSVHDNSSHVTKSGEPMDENTSGDAMLI